MRTTILIASLLVGLAGCYAESASEGSAAQPVINGDPTNEPAVVALVDGSGWFCSGTVISEHVILTAAHCLEFGAPTGIYFGTNANNLTQGTVKPVGQVLMHPDYPNSGDIGVVEITEAAGVAPSPLNRTALTAGMAGQDVRVVGFGLSEDNGDAAGVKLTGLTTFDSLENDYMLVRPKDQQSGCYGDSGGPNYMMIGGNEVLAGVTSFGTEDSCLAGFGGNTDVEKYAAWVDDFVEMIDGAVPDPDPSCSADGMCVADCSTPDPDCPVDPGPDPDDDGDDDDTDGDGGGGGAESGGCSTGGGQGGLFALALLGLVSRRRRRA
jgi:MYXO-CTERM domain-containing protein